jgi:hypothetical protein
MRRRATALFSLLVLLSLQATEETATEPSGSYVDCINAQSLPKQTTYDDFVAGRPSRWVFYPQSDPAAGPERGPGRAVSGSAERLRR